MNTRTYFKRIARLSCQTAAAAVFVIFALPASAQFRASIQGTVSDPDGGVIPGATLTLTDNDTNRVMNATSNDSGVYNFNALPPDHFTLSATAKGFQQKVISGVQIIPEQANAVNVQLLIGEATTTVNVSSDTMPSLDTETANLQGVVSASDIQHLPSSGRDVFQLAQLAPGAFGDGAQGGGGGSNNLPGTQGPGGSGGGAQNKGIFQTENGPQTLSGGGQYETNSINIDGISTTSAVWGGTTVITPNEDSIDNVKLTTNGYDAEFGRFSGTNMQVTTKSGTNQIHGSIFFRAVRPGLNAYQRYNGPSSLKAGSATSRGLLRDNSRYNDIGGSVGGPILKNRLFAFFAYETLHNNSQSTSNSWFETPAFDASAPAANISNKFTTFKGHSPVNAILVSAQCSDAGLAEGVNCRSIPGKGIDVGSPLKTAKGTQDPTYVSTSNPGVGGGLDGVEDLALYQTSTPSLVTQSQYNGRLDADVTTKDHLAFAIYWVPNVQHFVAGAARGYNQFNHNQTNDAFSVIYNHTFTPTFLNEARANAAGFRWNEVADNPQAPFGLPSDNISNYGNATIQSFGAAGPSHLNQWTFGYKDVATKIVSNHTIKFGADATQLHYLQDAVYAARPSFNFYNLWNFLNDAPYQESGTFNRFTGVPFSNRYDMREVIWGGFVQDAWKVSQSLTLNYGVRYNYFAPLYSKQNNLPHVVFGSGSSTFTGISLVRGGSAWTADKGNFGPQFGFAYNPAFLDKKFVIRGGYGLNYNQEEIAISANGSFNPNDAVSPAFGQSTPLAADPHIQYNVPTDSSSLFGYPSNPNTITNYGSNGLPSAIGSSFNLIAYPNHLHTQQTHHYSLDVEADLGHQMVASVGYQGTSGKHLIFHQNLYVYGQRQGFAYNPASPFIEYFGDGGGSNYNALLADIKHNFSHQFSIDASFTYSKSMDDNSGPYEEDPYSYNPVYARGRSDFNFGKAFKLYGTYQPVLYHGDHQILRTLANGFGISGIYNLHSGFPWTPLSNSGTAAYYTGSGYGTLRPASYTGTAGHDTSNSAFIAANGPSSNFKSSNTAHPALAYFTAPVYTSVSYPAPIVQYPVPGIARNSFNGPRYEDVDATITKSFGLPKVAFLGENSGLEFRADAFNLFNQTNLSTGSISNDINNQDFGIARSALGSRTVQLQARFSF